MVTIKFVIEVVLVIIGLAIVIFWIYTNYSNIVTAFQNWLNDVLSW